MKIEIITYKREHAYDILDRNVRECDVWLTNAPDWEKWAVGWETSGPSYTLVIDDQIVACAGVVLMNYNRGEAWTLFSPLINKYPKTCFKAIRDELRGIVSEHGLKRVQALVRPGLEVAERFVEHLGFEKEGVLVAFGPGGEDMTMYGRIN
jgi:RimJ/RimL family protein N-acetyltransferase